MTHSTMPGSGSEAADSGRRKPGRLPGSGQREDEETSRWVTLRDGRRIPQASLRILPGEGHLIFLTHWPEIVEDLLKERRA